MCVCVSRVHTYGIWLSTTRMTLVHVWFTDDLDIVSRNFVTDMKVKVNHFVVCLVKLTYSMNLRI